MLLFCKPSKSAAQTHDAQHPVTLKTPHNSQSQEQNNLVKKNTTSYSVHKTSGSQIPSGEIVTQNVGQKPPRQKAVGIYSPKVYVDTFRMK